MGDLSRRGSVDLLRDLEDAGALTETSLLLNDASMPYDRYEALGHFLGRMNRSCAFWIGDWLNFGEKVYGEAVAQAAEATGLAPQTLANRLSVCRHIPPDRRRPGLPFGVHAEVAYLEPHDRDRWLDQAELEQWTRARLREEMKKGHLTELPPLEAYEDAEQEHRFHSGSKMHTCPSCGYTWGGE